MTRTFSAVLAVSLATLSVSSTAQAAFDAESASKIAKGYALGMDRNVEERLDGETLDQALASPKNSVAGFEFLLQDVSGDCGVRIVVDREGEVVLEMSDAKWNCD